MEDGWVVSARVSHGERVRHALREGRWLDLGRRVTRRGDEILLPVRRAPPPSLVSALGVDVRRDVVAPRDWPNPFADIARRLPRELVARAPRHWNRIGDVLVLRLPANWGSRRQEVASAYASVLRAKTVVVGRGIRGPWRVPDVEVVWGGGTETVHVEDGVRFELDVARVMFSPGNLAERQRMGRIVRPGETVVDLFAGIGYFALPIAVHGRPERVVAIEVNPTAFSYLEKNVRLNRAWRVEPRLGDCSNVAPRRIADRIVMGYLDGGQYLDAAMRAAKDKCILHYHDSTPWEAVPAGPWFQVTRAATRAGFHAQLLAARRIKSYAPRVGHIVLDVHLSRRLNSEASFAPA